MTNKTLHAWLIHKQWSGDTSARAYFFTAESGLIHCLYKGGRTPKKQALLQPFTPLWVQIAERHDYYYAQTLESTSSMLSLTGTSLFSALYLNELIYYTLKPQEPEAELFQAYEFALHHLALTKHQSSVEALLRRFEWTLLQACGHGFSLSHDAETGQLVQSHHYYQLVTGLGMILAPKGIPGEHLLALAADDLTQTDYLKSAKIIMRKAINHLLNGREIKARSLFVD